MYQEFHMHQDLELGHFENAAQGVSISPVPCARRGGKPGVGKARQIFKGHVRAAGGAGQIWEGCGTVQRAQMVDWTEG